MQQRKVGVQSSIVVDIDLSEGIVMDSSIFKHFCVILTGNIVDYFFIVEGSGEDGTVENKQVSNVLFIYYQKRFDLVPGIH